MSLQVLVAPGTPGGSPADAAALERLYAHAPGVLRAGFVVALDGAVEVDGRSGTLGGDDDREVFATIRSGADAILVGAGTARAEGYGPAWLSPLRRARRGERGQQPLPSVAVVSGRADLDPGSRLFSERRDDQPAPPRPIVITSQQAPADRLRALAEVAEVVVSGREGVDPAGAVAALRERGLDRIVCEGGPTLFAGLLAAGLVDELCLSHAPLLAGPGHATLDGRGPELEGPSRFRLAHLLAGDSLLLARYVRDA